MYLRSKLENVKKFSEQLNEKFLEGLEHLSEKHAVNFAYASFAFIFIYYGLQKPLPLISPVDTNIAILGQYLGVQTQSLIYFVGFYEIFLGFLFLFKVIRYLPIFFLAHQVTTFASLLALGKNAFNPPWMVLFNHDIPVILNSYSAFVLKNLIFIACFMFLFREETKNNPTN